MLCSTSSRLQHYRAHSIVTHVASQTTHLAGAAAAAVAAASVENHLQKQMLP